MFQQVIVFKQFQSTFQVESTSWANETGTGTADTLKYDEENVDSTTLDYSVYEYYDLEEEESFQQQPTAISPTSTALDFEAILNGKISSTVSVLLISNR